MVIGKQNIKGWGKVTLRGRWGKDVVLATKSHGKQMPTHLTNLQTSPYCESKVDKAAWWEEAGGKHDSEKRILNLLHKDEYSHYIYTEFV